MPRIFVSYRRKDSNEHAPTRQIRCVKTTRGCVTVVHLDGGRRAERDPGRSGVVEGGRHLPITLGSALIAHLVGDGPEEWGFAAGTSVLWGLSYFFWRRVAASNQKMN